MRGGPPRDEAASAVAERKRERLRPRTPCVTPLRALRSKLKGVSVLEWFAVWERRGSKGRNVTCPARQYSVNGERRSFALLRPMVDATPQNRICELVLEAFSEYEEQANMER